MRAYTKGDLQGLLQPVPHSCGMPLPSHISTGDPPTLVGGFGSVSYGVTAPFLWVLVHAKFCLCPPSLESLFPSVLWKTYNQIPLAFKVRFPGDSQSICRISRLGSLAWGSESSQQWENFFWYYCSPVCGSSTRWVWDLILS